MKVLSDSMDAREYLSVRKAYNNVRKEADKSERLSFSEFSILCHLSERTGGLKTSDIADYQHVLRPTMTHRTKRLEEMGLISRGHGNDDRRNIYCEITPRGMEWVDRLSELTRQSIRPQEPLARTTAQRVRAYVDAMGEYALDSREQVLLVTLLSECESLKIGQIVSSLNLLQPTVSMCVSTLAGEGLLVRDGAEPHGGTVSLTPEGRERAQAILDGVEALTVRRKRQPAG